MRCWACRSSLPRVCQPYASTGRASGEQGVTRPPFVRRRLERRDEATEALTEAKEVRPSRTVHGLSKPSSMRMQNCRAWAA